jgi:hypothetical protein
LVAVLQAPPALDALAVEEGAIARDAVVGDGPRAAEPLELRVQPRDLDVPAEAEQVAGVTPHRHPAVLGQREDALLALAVAQQQKRPAGALGCEPLGDVARRRGDARIRRQEADFTGMAHTHPGVPKRKAPER